MESVANEGLNAEKDREMIAKSQKKEGWRGKISQNGKGGSLRKNKDAAYRPGSGEADEFALMLELHPSDGLGEYSARCRRVGTYLMRIVLFDV